MEKIKTYRTFKTESKPEIEELHAAGQVHENELNTEEEIENEETAEEFLQNAAEDNAAVEIQMDETVVNDSPESTLTHIKLFTEF